MGKAASIIFIMWNSISSLEAWYDFWFNISCGVAVMVRSHQEKNHAIFQGDGRGNNFEGRANFQDRLYFQDHLHFLGCLSF